MNNKKLFQNFVPKIGKFQEFKIFQDVKYCCEFDVLINTYLKKSIVISPDDSVNFFRKYKTNIM